MQQEGGRSRICIYEPKEKTQRVFKCSLTLRNYFFLVKSKFESVFLKITVFHCPLKKLSLAEVMLGCIFRPVCSHWDCGEVCYTVQQYSGSQMQIWGERPSSISYRRAAAVPQLMVETNGILLILRSSCSHLGFPLRAWWHPMWQILDKNT